MASVLRRCAWCFSSATFMAPSSSASSFLPVFDAPHAYYTRFTFTHNQSSLPLMSTSLSSSRSCSPLSSVAGHSGPQAGRRGRTGPHRGRRGQRAAKDAHAARVHVHLTTKGGTDRPPPCRARWAGRGAVDGRRVVEVRPSLMLCIHFSRGVLRCIGPISIQLHPNFSLFFFRGAPCSRISNRSRILTFKNVCTSTLLAVV